jgi:uncharacterized membrane protein
MRVRYLVLIVTLFLASIFAAQISFAHPPNLHDDTAQEQAVQQQPAKQDTSTHENDDKAATDHHDDEGSAPHEHGDKPVADHHAVGGESAEHGHEGGGHDQAGGEAGGHSHWGISPDSTPFSKFMAAFGKFHPLIVHFPIALFLTAAFAQVLNMRSKNGAYDKTVSLLVWLGALGALGAGLLGWAHSGPMQAGENTVMSAHRWIGTSLLIGGFITAFLMSKTKKADGGLIGNKAFNVFLFAMALGVAINGFLGGALAHGGIKHLMPGMM